MTDLAQTVALLERLIAFPTVSSESNLDLIHDAANHLEVAGARVRLSHNPERTKANLFATIGPECDGGVILSGHSDVVPVEGQDWTSDPFRARHDGDRIVGRGACDMKGFIACALAMAPGFAEIELQRPLHIALTYDEETGCLGAPVLLSALQEDGPCPATCIIGEPTDMKVIEGHKGCFEYSTHFHGLEGHGSLPDKGVNAVEYAVRYASELMAAGEDMKADAPPDSPFEPPWTTVSIGAVTGGVAHNVIPHQCRLDWEFRPINARDADSLRNRIRRFAEEELLPRMQAVHAEAAIRLETIGEVGGLEPMPGSEAVALARVLTGENATGLVSFGTEAGLFQQAGISTVVCGPGSIDQAHKPDEFVERAQLQACLAMIKGLRSRLAA